MTERPGDRRPKQGVPVHELEHLVVALDGSSSSERGWEHSVLFAQRLELELHAVTVVTTPSERDAAGAMLESLTADPIGMTVSREVLVDEDPASAIVQTADRCPGAVIGMATRAARPVSELVFGSVAANVLRRARRAVLLIGCESTHVPERLLVCLDPSEASRAILPVARPVAAAGLETQLLHVIYPPVDPVTRAAELSREDEQMYADLSAQSAAWEQDGLSVNWEVASGTVPSNVILKRAVNMRGVIAMATHGRTALARMLVGSVTMDVVRAAPVPVLTVRPDALLH
jgi:nucleotide-binding universal stress UspA family protein